MGTSGGWRAASSAMDMFRGARQASDVRIIPSASEMIPNASAAIPTAQQPTLFRSTAGAAVPSASDFIPSSASASGGMFRVQPSAFIRNDAAELDPAETVEIDWSLLDDGQTTLIASGAATMEPVEKVVPHHRVATEAIDEARNWLEHVCPAALTNMEGATVAYDTRGPDFEAKTALCCRRALIAVADVVCPSSEPKSDRTGHEHDLGDKNYANRLLRRLDQAQTEDGEYKLAGDEIKFLSALIDHVIDRSQKGVHYHASPQEAWRILFQTWAVLNELAQVASR